MSDATPFPRPGSGRLTTPPRRTGMGSTLAALESAIRRFEDPEELPEAEAAVRRLARMLAESGNLDGRPDLRTAPEAVLHAGAANLAAASAGLVSLLHRSARAAGAGSGGVILVVEDDRLFGRTLEAAVAAQGRHVVLAESARAAREVLRHASVDLVVLDLILPDDDGRSLLVELRSDPRTAGIPVFVVSARLGAQTKGECFALGADAYFDKPLALDAFGIAVTARLERQSTQADAARRDSVTGLPNRAAFLERAAQLRDNQGSDSRVALAVLDLDHFRWLEETWGRQFAEEVLRRCGSRLEMALRQAAVFARWDGAEFIALFVGRTAAEAGALVNQARMMLRRLDFRGEGDTPVTLSFSAGVVDLPSKLSIQEGLAQADRLRYLAKSTGRDRVIAGEPVEPAPRPRVLLADDDQAMVKVVTRYLEHEGFEVVSFPDGAAALAGLPTSGASLVISDIQMPRLDGLGFLRGLRERPELQHLPVMMVTALGDEAHVVRAFELGADDYVTKPVSMRELAARLRRLLRRPSVSGMPVA
ncbi:MAG: response regulator [Gemmatimonadota bacterium]|nr:response regulator [Gemmatimonadota bacterium]